jgi:hypothetical protein
MEFTLFYQGELRSNGDALHKQRIRETLHPQMRRLWQLDPLVGCESYVEYPQTKKADICLLETVGDFVFAPLISDKLALTAQVTITMLRPERPGQVIQQSGDIDNRLKTLFDALSVPPHLEHLPKGYLPTPDQVPLFCLLQDDRLISSVAVHTERLLTHDEAVHKSHVVLLIQVKTRVVRHMWASIPFL